MKLKDLEERTINAINVGIELYNSHRDDLIQMWYEPEWRPTVIQMAVATTVAAGCAAYIVGKPIIDYATKNSEVITSYIY